MILSILHHFQLETVELLEAILICVYEVIPSADILYNKTNLIFSLNVQQKLTESFLKSDSLVQNA